MGSRLDREAKPIHWILMWLGLALLLAAMSTVSLKPGDRAFVDGVEKWTRATALGLLAVGAFVSTFFVGRKEPKRLRQSSPRRFRVTLAGWSGDDRLMLLVDAASSLEAERVARQQVPPSFTIFSVEEIQTED